MCSNIDVYWLVAAVATLLLFLCLALCLAFRYYQRWTSAKQCLLVLRQLEKPSKKQQCQLVSELRPPSTMAPSIPPKPPTPPRNYKIRKKLSLKPSLPLRSHRTLKKLSLKPPMPPRNYRIQKMVSVKITEPIGNHTKKRSMKPLPSPRTYRILKKLSLKPQRTVSVTVHPHPPDLDTTALEH
ncbi:uncharacterized protein [Procambarus clarkii]|uniref:uncharacterized protein n=1 Tax=Procambarus clarkii TaxID=6728 RepID=UPI001E674704|nr:uncharacterized protein LOC123763419 [Procambarus clarkii]